ncbi:hypothetical protein MKY41_02950 [Sporosarcina sp. FSL W7-1349]|uniref:hypothetical protein n=1 Tax=Sporosarcina sp. FSL W7-1349 TaxID=2921561 RepID=UPI0030FB465A
MNYKGFAMAVLLLTGLFGCSGKLPPLPMGEPPETSIQIGDDTYATKLGTYCWGTKCVDTVGPVEMLGETEPISAKPGETISFEVDHRPGPSAIHVEQFADGNQIEVPAKDNQFPAPTEPGIYYYSIGAWWMDEEDENLSHGDAFYAFKIEVQ